MSDAAARIFTLPPGVDFPVVVAQGLLARYSARPPEDLARVTLYLNSARMRRRVTEALLVHGPRLLPRMPLLSDLAGDPVLADLPAAISPLRRRLELAQAVEALLRREPGLAPLSALHDLADSLADLLDEMQGEGVAPSALAALDVSQHSAHWAKAQKFLAIIATVFGADTAQDPSARQRLAALRLAARWAAHPPQDAVIVAGSTGSRGATLALMTAVASLPMGAVILPGFDQALPAAVWDSMQDALTAEDHPQYRIRRFLQAMGADPAALAPWHDTPVAAPQRNALVSLSLRPAPVTDQWIRDGARMPDLIPMTESLTLIEATSPRQEALAIALILRDAVERGEPATLISPDRMLTRQVTAALDRWRIRPDDSAGRPLALSAPGRLLRHVAAQMGERLTAEALLTLLKHPLAFSGGERGAHLLLTRDLELHLRRKGPVFPDADFLQTWVLRRSEPEAPAWGAAVASLIAALGQAGDDLLPLVDHVARHLAVTEALARGTASDGSGTLWDQEPGEKARELMADLARDAPYGGQMPPARYRRLFDGLTAAGEVRDPATPHPLITILGPREAREAPPGLTVLGGLTEGSWPASAPPDPWLNRRMRKEAGLLLPERRIGLAAHDFQQAMGAGQVVLTRAIRNAESETVPSRWLNRLENLMKGLKAQNGPDAWAAMKARGAHWLRLAARLDAPDAAQRSDPCLQPAPRPQPRPPLAARPRELSLTRVSTLIRDPYAIYARYVLNLRLLPPLSPEPDLRERGTIYHAILERFVSERPPGETTVQARARLTALAKQCLTDDVPHPTERALWLGRFLRAVGHFLNQDASWPGETVLVEEAGRLQLTDLDFTLFGTPDRIDRLPDGQLHLIDYKSSNPPTERQQATFEKQLLLAAVMADRGAFRSIGPATVARITYLGLGSEEKVESTAMTGDLLDEHWQGLRDLVAEYRKYETGYTARRAMFQAEQVSDYDHLSRRGEWETSQRARPESVGDGP